MVDTLLTRDHINAVDHKKQEVIGETNRHHTQKIASMESSLYNQEIDYCKDLDDLPNIPRKLPQHSLITKRSHLKNLFGWHLITNYLGMTTEMRNGATDLRGLDTGKLDIVWDPFENTGWPDEKLVIHGPEWPALPEKPIGGFNIKHEKRGHNYFTALSDWNVKVHAKMGGWRFPTMAFPFPVDTDLWVPRLEEKGQELLLMSKRRNVQLVAAVKQFLINKGYNVTHFDYTARYEEKTYLDFLHKARSGVWIGQHESQGFGFQECLHMEIPLMVIDCGTMRAEGGGCPHGPFCQYGPEYNLAATSASSWSPLGGEIVSSFLEMVVKWDNFESKVSSGYYHPSTIVEEYVSPRACALRLLKLYARHRNIWCYQHRVGRKAQSFRNLTFDPNSLPIAYPSQQVKSALDVNCSVAAVVSLCID
jgi:hypothetical protein